MADDKFISVVIVTYNADKTLQRCLDSIYAQSNKRIEIIVIDGKSTDHTVQILVSNKIDYWISEEDSGIYDAMNKALFHITTKNVFFLGADDVLLPDFSEMITALIKPNTIYYANVIYKDRKVSGLISPYAQAKSGIFHQSIIYPALIFKKYKYNPKYKIAADYALNMKLHKDPEFTFEYVDFTIALYNHTGVSSETADIAFEKDKSKLIYNNFGQRIWLRYMFRKLKSIYKS